MSTLTNAHRSVAPFGAAGRLRRSALSRYLFVLPALLYLLVFMIYPLLYTFYLSFRNVNVTNFLDGSSSFIWFENYVSFISDPTFWPTLGITFAFTVGSLVFQHAIGFALALFFNKGFPLSGLMRGLLLVVWVLPAVVSASLWRWMFSGSYGLINAVLEGLGVTEPPLWLIDPSFALPAVIIANIWVGIPFHMLLVYGGLQTIPTSYFEAAAIDGASAWQRFVNITLPVMKPVVITALLLGFVHTFKAFDIIYVMTQGGPANATTVLSIGVYKLSFEYFKLGEGAAAANILLVIPLVLSVVYLWLRRKEESVL